MFDVNITDMAESYTVGGVETDLVFQHALGYLCSTTPPDKLIRSPLEWHTSGQQGDIQVKDKAQHICTAGCCTKTKGR